MISELTLGHELRMEVVTQDSSRVLLPETGASERWKQAKDERPEVAPP